MGRALGIAIWIITLGSVGLFVSKHWWFPEAISQHGPAVDRQFTITIIVCGIAFAAAQIGLGWVVWKYRATADKQRATYSHGNNRLEVVWTLVTAVIFIGLAVMGQSVWASLHLHSAPPGSYQVRVIAQQFSWNFHYPGKDNLFGRTDTKTGKYELACAELCGMNHYKMKSYMLVLPENEFNELVALPQSKFQARKDELLNKYQLPQY